MKRLFALVLSCFLTFTCCYAETVQPEIKPWYEDGLGKYIPDPATAITGELSISRYSFINTDSMFFAELDGVTQSDFDNYSELAKKFGYNEHIESYGVAYSAVYKGKYKIGLMFADLPSDSSVDYMIITLDIVS